MDILLIEDEPGMRSLLQHSLESRGHAVTAVADGESGWENHQSRDFPLVILDWLLPGIDGLEVCRRIRSSPKSADSLVLVITGCTNPGDLNLALAAGADDYLAKPVEAALLNIRLAIVEQRVNRLNQQREAARMLGTVQDITERKRAERRAKYLRDAIETIAYRSMPNNTKSSFCRSTTHRPKLSTTCCSEASVWWWSRMTHWSRKPWSTSWREWAGM